MLTRPCTRTCIPAKQLEYYKNQIAILRDLSTEFKIPLNEIIMLEGIRQWNFMNKYIDEFLSKTRERGANINGNSDNRSNGKHSGTSCSA